MATIDDVYAYLTGPIVTSLNVIVDSVNSNPSIAGNGVIDVATHTQDLAILMYDFLVLLNHAFLSGDPDTLGQYISEGRFASLDIINGYLKDPPDFDPGSNILKETKDLADKIWDAVHRTVSVPEE